MAKSGSRQTAPVAFTDQNPMFRTPPRISPPKLERRCFTCGWIGHFARDCSLRGRSTPAEARGRGSARGAGQGPRVNHRSDRKHAGVDAAS